MHYWYRKNPDAAILSNFDDDDYIHTYSGIEEAFKALTKDDILKCYLSEHDFRFCNDVDNIGYNLYVFDIRCQKNFKLSQPTKIENKFPEIIDAGIYGYALVLTNELVSINSDGQQLFDII